MHGGDFQERHQLHASVSSHGLIVQPASLLRLLRCKSHIEGSECTRLAPTLWEADKTALVAAVRVLDSETPTASPPLPIELCWRRGESLPEEFRWTVLNSDCVLNNSAEASLARSASSRSRGRIFGDRFPSSRLGRIWLQHTEAPAHGHISCIATGRRSSYGILLVA